jgi:hypothetical protein
VHAAPPIQTTVVAVSPSGAHRPFRDGRAWRGDRLRVTIRDARTPNGIALTGRVCFTVRAAHSTECERFQFGRTVLNTIEFVVERRSGAIVSWYQGSQLLATRRLRVTG